MADLATSISSIKVDQNLYYGRHPSNLYKKISITT